MVPHHGTEGPLHYRAFRHSLVARVVSSGGAWMQTVAAGWLIYRLTGSAAAVGVLTVASRGPALVLSSVGGELAQRHDPRRLAIALALLQVVPPALLAVLASLDADTTLIIYALVLAGGILSSLALAPSTWISSHSVPPELRRKAIGESSVAYNIARFFGPLVAGGLIASAGPEACFAVNAGSFWGTATGIRNGGAAAPRGARRTHVSRGRAIRVVRRVPRPRVPRLHRA